MFQRQFQNSFLIYVLTFVTFHIFYATSPHKFHIVFKFLNNIFNSNSNLYALTLTYVIHCLERQAIPHNYKEA